MGAGKSWLLGHLKKSGPDAFDYIDLDQMLLQRSGYNTVLKMMKALGEEHFRRVENEVLVQLLMGQGNLVALGGGALNQKLNHGLSRSKDVLVVWLDTPLEQCLANLRKDHKNVRPLLAKWTARVPRGVEETPQVKVAEIAEFYRQRREIYSVAQVRLTYEQLPAVADYSQFSAELARQLLLQQRSSESPESSESRA